MEKSTSMAETRWVFWRGHSLIKLTWNSINLLVIPRFSIRHLQITSKEWVSHNETNDQSSADFPLDDVLLVLDLSRNFTNQDSSVYTSIDKGPDVPNALIEGVLWYSKVTRKIYQLGGWFSFNSVNDPGYITNAQLPESSIWEFDIDLKTWAQSALSYVNTGSKVDRPGTPANCDVPSLNRSFLFEGYVQQRSDHDYMNYTVSSTFKCR